MVVKPRAFFVIHILAFGGELEYMYCVDSEFMNHIFACCSPLSATVAFQLGWESPHLQANKHPTHSQLAH
jgi:hypothetical protein